MDTDEVFQLALGLPEIERTAYLEKACHDVNQRERLKRMLNDDWSSGVGEVEDETVAIAEGPGNVVGPYKLLEKIGEGAFGVVFMAEQRGDLPRRVALKIIKEGMDTREVIARFEVERRALAMMEHSHIAKVFDAGATETGRPYFVMELVRGVPITQFCDEKRYTVRQRLALFMEVCDAVTHAHQKGIIHRDLKPSNILVGLDGEKPVPKVIDFGIAKATQQRLTEKTCFTSFKQFIGTFPYLCPEQSDISAVDIDTRADIYALGVVLYELLAGKLPFNPKTLHRAGFDAMRRVVRDVEPLKPSTQVATLRGKERRTVETSHGAERKKLRSLIRGDLDWIVMKAMEKDRERRYETANALRRDVERFFNDEPVEAGPPGSLYRARKFIRRNRAQVAIAVLLVAGIASTTWFAGRADSEAEKREQAEADRREAVWLKKVAERAMAEKDWALEQLEEAQLLRLPRLAHRELESDNVAQAEKLLEELPYGLRSWEWHYVKRLCHPELLSFEGHRAGVWSVAFSPKGTLAVSTSLGEVKLWDVTNGRELQTFNGQRGWLPRVAFSPDGSEVCSAGFATIKFWDPASGEVRLSIDAHGLLIKGLAYRPDGRRIASAGDDSTTRLWDAKTGQPLDVLRGQLGEIQGLSFSPDGKRLATASERRLQREEGWLPSAGDVKIWDVTSKQEARIYREHTGSVTDVTFSSDGRWLASCSGKHLGPGTVIVREARTGEVVHTFRDPSRFNALAFTSKSRVIALTEFPAPDEPGVREWDITTGRELVRPWFRRSRGEGLAVCLDGNLIAIGEKIVDAAGQEFSEIYSHVPDRAFSPDSTRLALAGFGASRGFEGDGDKRTLDTSPGVLVVDPKSGEKLLLLNGGGHGVAYSPDGSLIASGDRAGSIRVWKAKEGELLWNLRGHLGLVDCVAFSPDGRRLASGGADGTVRIWDPQRGLEVLRLAGHSGGVTQVAFSPDGIRIASSGEDATVRVWEAGKSE